MSCKESCGNSNPESVNGDPLEELLDGEGDVQKYILVAGDSDSCAIVESSDCFFVIAGRCEIISVSIVCDGGGSETTDVMAVIAVHIHICSFSSAAILYEDLIFSTSNHFSIESQSFRIALLWII